MNAKLTSLVNQLPANLEKATTADEIRQVIVEIEAAALKSNIEENSSAPYVSREYQVGGPNTRGLSWKLNLLRSVAAANFCQMVRLGVHGGEVRVLGQEDNLNLTFAIYDALVPRYEELAKSAFQEHADAPRGEGETVPHRVGWVNGYLQSAPDEAFAAVNSAREEGGSKVSAFAERANEQLAELKKTFAPAKPEKAPKSPKAPKSDNTEGQVDVPAEAETTSVNAD